MIKDTMIVSCERAGTHFFIDSLVWNYGYNKKRVDVPPIGNQKKFETFLKKYEPTGHNIIKSHHQFEFFEPIFDIVKKKFHIFYIMREGKDVMVSWHHYFNNTKSTEFPFTKDVGDLMRKNPTSYSFDLAYSKIKSENMVQRWAKHIDSWFNNNVNSYREYVNYIFYEELYSNFKWTLLNISPIIKRKINNEIKRPFPNTGSGILPRKGMIGDWINYFHPLDEKYFYDQLNDYKYIYDIMWNKDPITIQYIQRN